MIPRARTNYQRRRREGTDSEALVVELNVLRDSRPPVCLRLQHIVPHRLDLACEAQDVDGGDGGELNPPSRKESSCICYKRMRPFDLARRTSTAEVPLGQQKVLGRRYLRHGRQHPGIASLTPRPPGRGEGERRR